jgi:hypothetical protein
MPPSTATLGLAWRETAGYRRPPTVMRRSLPIRHRTLTPLLDWLAGGMVTLSLFETAP